jgi:hypothetical protein
MPEYALPQTQEGKELDALADQEFWQANEANDRSDKYVLLTVIFASVLFFGGISTQFESRAIETGMLVVVMIVLIATAAVMLTFPLKPLTRRIGNRRPSGALWGKIWTSREDQGIIGLVRAAAPAIYPPRGVDL